MDVTTWKHVVVIVTALLCATAAELYALSQGINGNLLAGYLCIIGSVIGVPVGMVLQKKKNGT